MKTAVILALLATPAAAFDVAPLRTVGARGAAVAYNDGRTGRLHGRLRAGHAAPLNHEPNSAGRCGRAGASSPSSSDVEIFYVAVVRTTVPPNDQTETGLRPKKMKLFVASIVTAVVMAGPPPEYLPSQLHASNGLATCADAKEAYQSGSCCGADPTTPYVPEYDGACENVVTYGKWRVTKKVFEQIPEFGPGATAASLMGASGDRLATWWRGNATSRVGFKMLYESWTYNEGANLDGFSLFDESTWGTGEGSVEYQEIELFEVAPSCSAMLINSYNNNIENSMPLYNKFMDEATFTAIFPAKYKDDPQACHAMVKHPGGFDQFGGHNGTLVKKTLQDYMNFVGSLNSTVSSPAYDQFSSIKIKFAVPVIQVCEK